MDIKRSGDTLPYGIMLDYTWTIHGRTNAASPFAGHIARSLTVRSVQSMRTPDR